MLQTQTVERRTFELLKILMSEPLLLQFSLVGGTALTLYMGHRLSIDIDLFSTEPFDAPHMEKYLADKYGFEGLMLRSNSLMGRIDNVIDMLIGDYSWNAVRQRLIEMARFPSRIFTNYPMEEYGNG